VPGFERVGLRVRPEVDVDTRALRRSSLDFTGSIGIGKSTTAQERLPIKAFQFGMDAVAQIIWGCGAAVNQSPSIIPIRLRMGAVSR
jgi:hypothetical protein